MDSHRHTIHQELDPWTPGARFGFLGFLTKMISETVAVDRVFEALTRTRMVNRSILWECLRIKDIEAMAIEIVDLPIKHGDFT